MESYTVFKLENIYKPNYVVIGIPVFEKFSKISGQLSDTILAKDTLKYGDELPDKDKSLSTDEKLILSDLSLGKDSILVKDKYGSFTDDINMINDILDYTQKNGISSIYLDSIEYRKYKNFNVLVFKCKTC